MKPGLCLLVFIVIGCDLLGSGGDGKDPPAENGLVFFENRYSLLGDTIFVKEGALINRYCSGDTLHVDTLPTFGHKIPFEINSDSMYQFPYPVDTLSSGTLRITYDILIREGKGQGLIGVWRRSGIGYRILAGEPSAEERKTMDSVVTAEKKLYSVAGLFTRYSESKQILFEKSDYGQARLEGWGRMSEWFPTPMSGLYDIDVRAVDSSTFEMKGRKTGETIRETRLDDGDMEYTSDVPTHDRHRHLRQPQSCPNPEVPDWYTLFLEANRK